MTAENEDFPQQLPQLLRMLTDPSSPHTNAELSCRIRSLS